MTGSVFDGKVKWFATKGQSYGYITYDLGEIYVHYSNIQEKGLPPECFRGKKVFKSLRKGDQVSFVLGTGFGLNKGTQALNVEVITYVGTNPDAEGESPGEPSNPVVED